jgi:hypothetical protein
VKHFLTSIFVNIKLLFHLSLNFNKLPTCLENSDPILYSH